jgi:hypothetical protein
MASSEGSDAGGVFSEVAAAGEGEEHAATDGATGTVDTNQSADAWEDGGHLSGRTGEARGMRWVSDGRPPTWEPNRLPADLTESGAGAGVDPEARAFETSGLYHERGDWYFADLAVEEYDDGRAHEDHPAAEGELEDPMAGVPAPEELELLGEAADWAVSGGGDDGETGDGLTGLDVAPTYEPQPDRAPPSETYGDGAGLTGLDVAPTYEPQPDRAFPSETYGDGGGLTGLDVAPTYEPAAPPIARESISEAEDGAYGFTDSTERFAGPPE